MTRKALARLSKYELIEYIESLEKDIEELEKKLKQNERKEDEHTSMGHI